MNPRNALKEVWIFDLDDSNADLLPIVVFKKFYGGMCIGHETRLNYSRHDAQTLVDYLNSRAYT